MKFPLIGSNFPRAANVVGQIQPKPQPLFSRVLTKFPRHGLSSHICPIAFVGPDALLLHRAGWAAKDGQVHWQAEGCPENGAERPRDRVTRLGKGRRIGDPP